MIMDWKRDRHITQRSFRIVDLVEQSDGLITGKTFEDCTIYGPAVLAPLDKMRFEENTFEADPEALFWVIPEERNTASGAIGLIGCTFLRCTFRGIGIAGKQALIQRFIDASND